MRCRHPGKRIFRSLEYIAHPIAFLSHPNSHLRSLAYLLIWRFWFGKARWFSWILLAAIPLFCILKDVLGGLGDTSYQVWTNVPLATMMTVVMWLVAFFLGFLLFWSTAKRIAFVPETEEPLQVPSSKHISTTSK